MAHGISEMLNNLYVNNPVEKASWLLSVSEQYLNVSNSQSFYQ